LRVRVVCESVGETTGALSSMHDLRTEDRGASTLCVTPAPRHGEARLSEAQFYYGFGRLGAENVIGITPAEKVGAGPAFASTLAFGVPRPCRVLGDRAGVLTAHSWKRTQKRPSSDSLVGFTRGGSGRDWVAIDCAASGSGWESGFRLPAEEVKAPALSPRTRQGQGTLQISEQAKDVAATRSIFR